MLIEVTLEEESDIVGNVVSFAGYVARNGINTSRPFYADEKLVSLAGADVINLADRRH